MAAEHHILTLDCTNYIVMSGCYFEVLKHKGARIYTEQTIENGGKGVFTTAGPEWKLHIILHGTPVDQNDLKLGGELVNFTEDQVADLVVKSKLPNKAGAKVRLEACYSGMCDMTSAAAKLKVALETKYSPCEIQVSGPKGVNVLGWQDVSAWDRFWHIAPESHKRIVVNPDSKFQVTVAGKTVQMTADKLVELEYEEAEKHNSKKIAEADTRARSIKPNSSPEELEMQAKAIFMLTKKCFFEFRTRLEEIDKMCGNTLLLARHAGSHKFTTT